MTLFYTTSHEFREQKTSKVKSAVDKIVLINVRWANCKIQVTPISIQRFASGFVTIIMLQPAGSWN